MYTVSQAISPILGISLVSVANDDKQECLFISFSGALNFRFIPVEITINPQLVVALLTRPLESIIFYSQLTIMTLMVLFLEVQYLDLKAITVFDPKIAEYLSNSDLTTSDLELMQIMRRHELILPSGITRTQPLMESTIQRTLEELTSCHHVVAKQRLILDKCKILPVKLSTEIPMCFLLALMEVYGVYVDADQLKQDAKGVKHDIDEIVQAVRSAANRPDLNFASPEQVSKYLFDDLQLAPGSNPGISGKRKFVSTSECLYPMPTLLFLKSYDFGHYQRFYPRISWSRVHANWNLTTVSTGRVSFSHPNLQNIPVNGSNGISIRSAFKAPVGCFLVSADYSQIEVRVLAHLSRDAALSKLFHNAEEDIYIYMASQIFEKSPQCISDEERNSSKIICLGIMYGISHQSTASRLGISESAAASLHSTFFATFSDVQKCISIIKRQAKGTGYITTISGRRRYLPDIVHADFARRSYAERQAVNSVVQGSASDLIKVAMIAMHNRIAAVYQPCENSNLFDAIPRIVLQIHDELVYEVPIRYLSIPSTNNIVNNGKGNFIELLRSVMEKAVALQLGLTVPLNVNIKMGSSWDAMC